MLFENDTTSQPDMIANRLNKTIRFLCPFWGTVFHATQINTSYVATSSGPGCVCSRNNLMLHCSIPVVPDITEQEGRCLMAGKLKDVPHASQGFCLAHLDLRKMAKQHFQIHHNDLKYHPVPHPPARITWKAWRSTPVFLRIYIWQKCAMQFKTLCVPHNLKHCRQWVFFYHLSECVDTNDYNVLTISIQHHKWVYILHVGSIEYDTVLSAVFNRNICSW